MEAGRKKLGIGSREIQPNQSNERLNIPAYHIYIIERERERFTNGSMLNLISRKKKIKNELLDILVVLTPHDFLEMNHH